MSIDFVTFMAALIFSVGVWLLLSREWLKTIMGISMLGHAVNILLLQSSGEAADIFPQALILTAIVIGLGLQTLLLVFAYFARKKESVEDVDQLKEVP
ncbi:sodium:proton antiporter [Bdellovibrio bacteriovorus]|uniref:Sodium:proton antiporter n=1 Tax=Bdellovibrio bacteriovorus TaxID=959 RepID=A0A150WN74_BDEBC|nr:NADH-quinone oxidoreductase subunit K [Bdellovibrio bacteriovorus]KYG65943.1 sodium:proton antiporter [Bdellovibrio bacteriovorus]